VKGNGNGNMLAHHRLLTGFARAVGKLHPVLFPESDGVISVASLVHYDVCAELFRFDEEAFVLGSLDCSVQCRVTFDLNHCSVPFPFVTNLADRKKHTQICGYHQRKNADIRKNNYTSIFADSVVPSNRILYSVNSKGCLWRWSST
jgi:hypothetical protein